MKNFWNGFVASVTHILMGIAIALIFVAVFGCGSSRQAARVSTPAPTNAAAAMLSNGPGKVPVVIINPSQLIRHIWLFEGSEPVNVVPDYRTGKWVLSRPALYEFKMKAAKSRNWAEEERFYFPRNSAFVVYDQPERFWGSPEGQPFITYGYTGSSPVATTYWKQTPTGGQAVAGAVIQLPYVDAAGQTGGLNLEYEINPGAAIKEGIGRALR